MIYYVGILCIDNHELWTSELLQILFAFKIGLCNVINSNIVNEYKNSQEKKEKKKKKRVKQHVLGGYAYKTIKN